MGGESSGKNFVTIAYLCVTIVLLEHDDLYEVVGTVAAKLTLKNIYSFC